ncbi:MAP kinase kinase kinase, partial [Rhizoctonia solani]
MGLLRIEEALRELAKYHCSDLTEQVTFLGDQEDIAVIGGFYDIYKASLAGYEGVVAVKLSVNAILEHVVNELRVVSKLEHSNILPCLGYIVTEPRGSASYDRVPWGQQIIGVVYPWINLNLRDYLKLRPKANRAHLCNQVIEGLTYLHDTGVIHGDLRGRTVMISDQGTVQITGFGGSILKDDPAGYGNGFQMAGRWAASERLLPVGAEPTVKEDVWSLGMTLPTIIDRLVDQGCLNITKQLIYGNESHKYSGALSDVYQTRLPSGGLVAVKCLRALSNSESKPEKVFKRTTRELYAWSVSTHPNVLELVGLAVFRDKLAIVAPWMPYGSLLAFIDANPDYDRCRLCTQIAEGLIYIHGLGMAHGDIKGVRQTNRGGKNHRLRKCNHETRLPVAFTATESISYSIRWAAPELFIDEGIRNNYETDVYALGMVKFSDTYDVQLLTMKFFQTILEALTGTVPYKDKADLTVIHTVVFRREHPSRPVGCISPQSTEGDALWNLLGRCWSYDPQLRPRVTEVCHFLSSITQGKLMA